MVSSVTAIFVEPRYLLLNGVRGAPAFEEPDRIILSVSLLSPSVKTKFVLSWRILTRMLLLMRTLDSAAPATMDLRRSRLLTFFFDTQVCLTEAPNLFEMEPRLPIFPDGTDCVGEMGVAGASGRKLGNCSFSLRSICSVRRFLSIAAVNSDS